MLDDSDTFRYIFPKTGKFEKKLRSQPKIDYHVLSSKNIARVFDKFYKLIDKAFVCFFMAGVIHFEAYLLKHGGKIDEKISTKL